MSISEGSLPKRSKGALSAKFLLSLTAINWELVRFYYCASRLIDRLRGGRYPTPSLSFGVFTAASRKRETSESMGGR